MYGELAYCTLLHERDKEEHYVYTILLKSATAITRVVLNKVCYVSGLVICIHNCIGKHVLYYGGISTHALWLARDTRAMLYSYLYILLMWRHRSWDHFWRDGVPTRLNIRSTLLEPQLPALTLSLPSPRALGLHHQFSVFGCSIVTQI